MDLGFLSVRSFFSLPTGYYTVVCLVDGWMMMGREFCKEKLVKMNRHQMRATYCAIAEFRPPLLQRTPAPLACASRLTARIKALLGTGRYTVINSHR